MRNGKRVMGAVLLVVLALAAPAMAVPVVDGDGWLGWLAGWWSAVESVFASSSTPTAAPKDGEEPDGGGVNTTTSGEDGGEIPPPCPTPTTCPEGNSSMDPDG